MAIGYDSTSVPAVTSVTELLRPAYAGAVTLDGDPRRDRGALDAVMMASLAAGGSADNAGPGVDLLEQLRARGNLRAAVATGLGSVIIDWDLVQRELTTGIAGWKYFVPTGAAVGGYDTQAINRAAAHPAAARLWEEYLFSDMGQNLCLLRGARPARLDAMKADGVINVAASYALGPAPAHVALLTAGQVAAARAQRDRGRAGRGRAGRPGGDDRRRHRQRAAERAVHFRSDLRRRHGQHGVGRPGAGERAGAFLAGRHLLETRRERLQPRPVPHPLWLSEPSGRARSGAAPLLGGGSAHAVDRMPGQPRGAVPGRRRCRPRARAITGRRQETDRRAGGHRSRQGARAVHRPPRGVQDGRVGGGHAGCGPASGTPCRTPVSRARHGGGEVDRPRHLVSGRRGRWPD